MNDEICDKCFECIFFQKIYENKRNSEIRKLKKDIKNGERTLRDLRTGHGPFRIVNDIELVKNFINTQKDDINSLKTSQSKSKVFERFRHGDNYFLTKNQLIGKEELLGYHCYYCRSYRTSKAKQDSKTELGLNKKLIYLKWKLYQCQKFRNPIFGEDFNKICILNYKAAVERTENELKALKKVCRKQDKIT